MSKPAQLSRRRFISKSAAAGAVVARERILLVDAELSPLRIGRQPEVGDRRPLDEV